MRIGGVGRVTYILEEGIGSRGHGERLKQTGRIGGSWGEMGGGGKRWKEMERDGKSLAQSGRGGGQWEMVED